MAKHYHVLGGLCGCYMPNANYTCLTKKEAKAILSDCKKQEIDASYQMKNCSQFSITGSLKSGRYDVTGGGNEYYEITTCQEPDCLLHLDD